jgi:hypothetical protein
MRRVFQAGLLFIMTTGLVSPSLADEKEAKATIEKAIKAMGGEEKLSGVKAFTAKGKGQITLEGTQNGFTFQMTTQGIDKYRSTYKVEVGGKDFEGGTVLDGDKGWKKEGEEVKKLEGEALVQEKHSVYLDIVPMLIVPLKGKGFKFESAADDKVGDKPVAVVRVTGPEGKDFTIYFDKESGLPLKTSGSVADEQGQEDNHETTFEDYKEFGGIKVATRSKTLRGGKRYIEVEEMEFKALGEVEPGTFAEPK